MLSTRSLDCNDPQFVCLGSTPDLCIFPAGVASGCKSSLTELQRKGGTRRYRQIFSPPSSRLGGADSTLDSLRKAETGQVCVCVCVCVCARWQTGRSGKNSLQVLEVKTLEGLSVDDDDLFALCSGGALC